MTSAADLIVGSMGIVAVLMANATAQPAEIGLGPVAAATDTQRSAANGETDCKRLRLTIPGRERCWAWTRLGHAVAKPDDGTNSTIPAMGCPLDWEAARTSDRGFSGDVRYVALQPDASIYCTVRDSAGVVPVKMLTTVEEKNGVANLTYPGRSGERLFSPITTAEGRSCRAFIVLGPNVVGFGHDAARAYYLEGDLCAPPEKR